MTPELWTRCPKAEPRVAYPTDRDDPDWETWADWVCQCHGIGNACLVNVPFDEAVERMAIWLAVRFGDQNINNDVRPTPEAMAQAWGREADLALRAALGEDTDDT